MPRTRKDGSGQPRESNYFLLADLAGCDVEAFHFVRDVIRQASPGNGEHVTAGYLVEACRAWCHDHFDDEAEAVASLDNWGLRRSEDLGRVVYTMVDVGLLSTAVGDSLSDFDKLFTLDSLYRMAEPRDA